MPVLIEGVFARPRLLSLMQDFTVFGDTSNGLAKILAGYHQFHAVKRAVASTVEASRSGGDRKAGVIWHTQGSGKSLLMAFYAGQLVRDPAMENPTIVVITDRNDLDDQLFATFSMCRDLIRQTPVQADSREDLQKALSRASGGVVFTTIQKFAPEKGEAYPLLTDRRNVVVIADEAHRSQYGFKARIEKTGEIAYERGISPARRSGPRSLVPHRPVAGRSPCAYGGRMGEAEGGRSFGHRRHHRRRRQLRRPDGSDLPRGL